MATPTGLAVAGTVTPGTPTGTATYPDLAYIATNRAMAALQSSGAGVQTYDMSTPSAPTVTNTRTDTGQGTATQGVRVYKPTSSHALVAGGNSSAGLFLYDLAIPGSPTLVNSIGVGTIYAADFISGTHLAIRGFSGTHYLRTYTWSASGIGSLVGAVTVTAADVRELAVAPGGAICAWPDRGASQNRVFIGNLSNLAAPTQAGSVTNAALAEARHVEFFDGRWLFATGYTTGGGLVLIDCNTPSAPVVAASQAFGNETGGIAIIDGTYVAVVSGSGSGEGTVKIFDWSSRTTLTEVFTLTDVALNTLDDIVYDGSRYITGYSRDRRLVVIDTTPGAGAPGEEPAGTPISCSVPYPRWGEMGTPGEVREAMERAGVPDTYLTPIAEVLEEVLVEAARSEEANYEYLCRQIELLGPQPETPVAPLRRWTQLTASGGAANPSMGASLTRNTVTVWSGEGSTGNLREYDIAGGTWSLVANFTSTSARDPHATVGNKAYIHDFNADWERFDLVSKTHEGVVASMGFAQDQNESATAVDGKIYLIGRTTEFKVYDPATNIWTTLTSPPVDLWNIEGVPALGKIVGVDETTGTIPYVYDIAAGTWSGPLTAGPADHHQGASAAAGNFVHFFGGDNNTAWSEYDVVNDTWTALPAFGTAGTPPNASPLAVSAQGVDANTIYFIRGADFWRLDNS